MRKNPNNKSLVIVKDTDNLGAKSTREYIKTLRALLIAQSNLVRSGKSSGLPHFLAVVKELERLHNFSFELEENN